MTTRPIVLFIGGLGRSGSTLLDRALGEVPGYQSLGEVVHLWQRGLIDNETCGSGESFSACPFWNKVGHVAFGGWDQIDADEVLSLQRRVDRTRFVPLLAMHGVSPGLRTALERYASLLGDVYHAAAEVGGARVLIDSSKHVSTAYVLRHVAAVDPRIVHLVRDPRAVAYAWMKVKPRPSAGAGAEMARYTPGKTSIYYSVQNAMLDAMRFGSVPYLRVRYEDFTAAPAATIRRILALTGDAAIPLEAFDGPAVTLSSNHNIGGNPMKSKTGRVTIQRDDDWSTQLGRRGRWTVDALTAPHLLGYGYGFRRSRSR
jgi:hypothetical protein